MSRNITLSDFAASHAAGRTKCKICLLDDTLRAEVKAAEGKIPGAIVARWLREVHGLDLHNSGQQVRTHWSQHR